MRALFVTHAFPRSAQDMAGCFLLDLAQALRGVGVQIQVVAPHGPGLALDEHIAGVRVRRFRYGTDEEETLAYSGALTSMARSHTRQLQSAIGGAHFLRAECAAIRHAVAEWAPDVVHAHWWVPNGLAAVLSIPRGLPLITTMHGTDVRMAVTSRSAGLLAWLVARRASHLTAVSPWLARDMVRVTGREVVIAPMPARAHFLTVTRVPRHASAPVRLLFVGRLISQKGLLDLLPAVAELRGAATLAVVGAGPLEPRARALASTLGIGDAVTFHGALPPDALPARFARADIVVMPSVEEGLGMVAVEAQLAGVPVVAYDSGGLRDVISDGRTGVLTPPGDGAALVEALRSLIADPARADRLARAARAEATQRYSAMAAAENYGLLYADAIRRAARPR